MRVNNRNWSATKQRLYLQSVAEISHHSVLSGDSIQQCDNANRALHTPYWMVSFWITLNDLTKYLMTWSIARPLCDSWAACCNLLVIFVCCVEHLDKTRCRRVHCGGHTQARYCRHTLPHAANHCTISPTSSHSSRSGGIGCSSSIHHTHHFLGLNLGWQVVPRPHFISLSRWCQIYPVSRWYQG